MGWGGERGSGGPISREGLKKGPEAQLRVGIQQVLTGLDIMHCCAKMGLLSLHGVAFHGTTLTYDDISYRSSLSTDNSPLT